MNNPFLFLTLHTFYNRIRFRLRRLKEIRYLLGAIVGGGYFFFLFTRSHHARGYQRLTLDIGAVIIMVFMFLAWIFPLMSSLAFSEAELHFIVGGPVSRRRVMSYKFLAVQPQLLIGICVATFIGIPNGHFIGLWILYASMLLYMTFVAVARHRLNELGVSTSLISILGFIFLVASIGLIFWFGHKPVRGGPSPVDAPELAALLFIPRLLARPLFAKTPLAFAGALGGVIAFGVAMFLLASTLRVQFDELVQTASERVSRFRSRMQGQRGASVSLRNLRAPFRLREGAPAEMAIVWKNLIAVMRMANGAIFSVLGFSTLFLAGTIFLHNAGLKLTCAGFSLAFAAMFPLVGAMAFKQDYRLDITRADVLRTWPITGERLIAAEIAAPLVTMAILELVLLANAAMCTYAGRTSRVFTSPRAFVVAFLFAIPLCAMQLLLRNTVAVVFPAWAMRTREEQRGFAAFGQRILGMILNLIALSVTIAPAAAISALGWWIASHLAGDSAAVLAAATMPAVFLLAAECWLFVKILGAQYEKLDVGTDMEPMIV